MRPRLKLLARPQISLGGGILAFLVLVAVFAGQLSPHDPYEHDPPNKLAPSSREHILGTDNYGRDLMARLMFGGRISLFIGIASVLVGGVIGTMFGLVSGYSGGVVDLVIMRIADALLAFPTALVALAIIASLGSATEYVIMAIAIGVAPRFARVVHGSVLKEKTLVYVTATRALGAKDARILLSHILPNVLSPLIVTTTFMIATAILVEAFLGFLGLGVQPPTPTWGNIINEGLRLIRISPHIAVYPGVAITLAVLSFNLLGDGLRDALDPKLRGHGRI